MLIRGLAILARASELRINAANLLHSFKIKLIHHEKLTSINGSTPLV